LNGNVPGLKRISKAMTSSTESVTAFMEVMDQRVAEENPGDR
jgi:hypothetical protein